MKKNIIRFALAGFFLAGFTNLAVAQDTMYTLPPVVIITKTNVNKAVNDAFTKEFKDAMDPVWYRMNKDYLVNFITTDMKNSALFKKNGRLVYHIRYGHQNNLPEDVLAKVQQAYADYNITNAVNVRENNRDIWVVNLEGLKKLIVVLVEEGELEEVGNYNKSS
jgi:hypothetical protein